MSLFGIQMLAALVAAAVLVFSSSQRVAAGVALAACAVGLAVDVGLVRISIAGVSLSLVIGLVLAVTGVIGWLDSRARTPVTAGTVVTLVGLLRVLALWR